MATENKQTAEDIIEKIISEVWENEQFKNDLVKNPEATLEAFLGKKLNSGKNIIVTDQTNPDNLYINLPAKPNLEDMELNEEMLDTVSGGGNFADFWAACKKGSGLDYLAWQVGLIDVEQ